MRFALLFTSAFAAATTVLAGPIHNGTRTGTAPHNNDAHNSTIDTIVASLVHAAANNVDLAAFFMKPYVKEDLEPFNKQLEHVLLQYAHELSNNDKRDYYGKPGCLGIWGVCYPNISTGPISAGPCKC